MTAPTDKRKPSFREKHDLKEIGAAVGNRSQPSAGANRRAEPVVAPIVGWFPLSFSLRAERSDFIP